MKTFKKTVFMFAAVTEVSKQNLLYTRRITQNCVTSGGTHFRGLAPEQKSFGETSQRWQALGDRERPGKQFWPGPGDCASPGRGLCNALCCV